MQIRRRLQFVALLLTAALISPAPLQASNFGSHVSSGGTAGHDCDGSLYSQCVANNGVHYIFDFGLDSLWKTAVQPAMDTYNTVQTVSVYWVTTTDADVWGRSAV